MRRFLWNVLKWGGIVGFLVAVIITIVLIWWMLPDFVRGQQFDPSSLNYSVIITDRNGVELHRNFDSENREWTTLSEMPEHLRALTLLAEDRRFYSHSGVDLKGIARAMVANFESGEFSQGASTLTQQIARKAFLTDEKTITRKLREVAIALGLEWSMTKDEILELYLNTAPYGPTVAGVEAASGYYFSKPPAELTVTESLILATLPKDPVRLPRNKQIREWLGYCRVPVPMEDCHPFNASALYLPDRLDVLFLNYAQQLGWDDETSLVAWRELANFELPPHRPFAYDEFQHFQFYVRDFLTDKGIDLSRHPGGLRITTTLDAVLQRQMYDWGRETMGAELFTQHNAENFAFVVLDHASRGPLVWVGSKAFWNEQINGQIDMLRSRRQLGSSMKPFIYAAAIAAGHEPNTKFLDSRVKFAGESHVLQNADGQFMGWMGMAKALAQSRNVPAAQALYLAGGESVVKQYLDNTFGFDITEAYPDHPFGWTLALGTAPVPLVDAANAYATLGSGQLRDLCPILRIETQLGKELPNPCNRAVHAQLSDETRFFMANMLTDWAYKPQNYWGKLRVPGYDIATKTGTSNKREGNVLVPADNLLASYTPEATMLLWAGNTSGKALNGGSFALESLGGYLAPMWDMVLAENAVLYSTLEPPETVQRVGQYWVQNNINTKKWNIPGLVVLGGHWGTAPKPTVVQGTARSGGGGAVSGGPAPVQEVITEEVQFVAPVFNTPVADPTSTPPPPKPTKADIRANIQQRYQE